jgi:hypothetical protein
MTDYFFEITNTRTSTPSWLRNQYRSSTAMSGVNTKHMTVSSGVASVVVRRRD